MFEFFKLETWTTTQLLMRATSDCTALHRVSKRLGNGEEDRPPPPHAGQGERVTDDAKVMRGKSARCPPGPSKPTPKSTGQISAGQHPQPSQLWGGERHQHKSKGEKEEKNRVGTDPLVTKP